MNVCHLLSPVWKPLPKGAILPIKLPAESRTQPRLDGFLPQAGSEGLSQIKKSGPAGVPALEVPALEVSTPTAKLPVQLSCVDIRQLTYKADPAALKRSLEKRGISLMAIRHGQSEMNASAVPVTSGQIETPLTEKGREQAREAARKLYEQMGGSVWLQNIATGQSKAPAIYASPLTRAHDTAKIFADYVTEQGRGVGLPIDLSIQVDDRLLEMHFGKYEGCPDADSWNEHPSLWSEAEFAQRCPNGESRVDVMERLHSFLSDVRDRHENHAVMMFCHLMPVALSKVLMGDGRTDEAGVLKIHRPDYPNATPITLTQPGSQSQAQELGYLLA